MVIVKNRHAGLLPIVIIIMSINVIIIIIIIPDLARRLHTPSKGNIHSFQISRISKELSSVGVLTRLSDPT